VVTVSFDLTPAQVAELLKPRTPTNALARMVTRWMANPLAAMAARVAGPTTVDVSEAGLRITTGAGVRDYSWTQVGAVNERGQAWVMQFKPNGLAFIPASAVAPEERAAFTQQLRAWAGGRYRVREGLADPAAAHG
jgi:hypothetical protein